MNVLAILELIFDLPAFVVLVVGGALITGAATTLWFSRARRGPVRVTAVVEPDAKPEVKERNQAKAG